MYVHNIIFLSKMFKYLTIAFHMYYLINGLGIFLYKIMIYISWLITDALKQKHKDKKLNICLMPSLSVLIAIFRYSKCIYINYALSTIFKSANCHPYMSKMPSLDMNTILESGKYKFLYVSNALFVCTDCHLYKMTMFRKDTFLKFPFDWTKLFILFDVNLTEHHFSYYLYEVQMNQSNFIDH
jgi:hypothetical protein